MSRYDYCEILCGGVGQERARIENSEHGTSDSWECAKVSIHTRNCTTKFNYNSEYEVLTDMSLSLDCCLF